jgi:hypothetical protein
MEGDQIEITLLTKGFNAPTLLPCGEFHVL